ncbi:uncharacterized protein LOC128429875 isoform X1 [Pleuronectes platessa]|uniref:uncharacterized protein LOC128429875 isoform X1 n=1 Tax=Pleuronectes platessa TaxID=8262 RepID=UPI00232A6884|nr:uncharacterized protein LOC128429875 isoform X1 [Pleuronectes platessa]
MELLSLCIPLLILTLVAEVHSLKDRRDDAAFPHFDPQRLQLFQYESVSISCEDLKGLSEWRVMRRLKDLTPSDTSSWETSTRSRTIKTVHESDSGEYWCEDEHGEKSNAVNVTVGGELILDIPLGPVMEGDDLTLSCIMEKPFNRIAEFFRDNVRITTGYKGVMSIFRVSKSDEGLYKCNVSGVGESPESWLNVQGKATLAVHKDNDPSSSGTPHLVLLWTLTIVLLGSLLLLGLLYRNRRALICCSSDASALGSDLAMNPTAVSRQDSSSGEVFYSVINKRPR